MAVSRGAGAQEVMAVREVVFDEVVAGFEHRYAQVTGQTGGVVRDRSASAGGIPRAKHRAFGQDVERDRDAFAPAASNEVADDTIGHAANVEVGESAGVLAMGLGDALLAI